MPEQTTETIESPSAVLSCDNSSQDVGNTNINAKNPDKSNSSTCPPPLSSRDSSVANSASTDSNSKSDNSCINPPLKKHQLAGTQEAKRCSMDIEKCFNADENPGLDLEANNYEKSLTDHDSSHASNVKTCFSKTDETLFASSCFKAASQIASALSGPSNPSTELELKPLSNYLSLIHISEPTRRYSI